MLFPNSVKPYPDDDTLRGDGVYSILKWYSYLWMGAAFIRRGGGTRRAMLTSCHITCANARACAPSQYRASTCCFLPSLATHPSSVLCNMRSMKQRCLSSSVFFPRLTLCIPRFSYTLTTWYKTIESFQFKMILMELKWFFKINYMIRLCCSYTKH